MVPPPDAGVVGEAGVGDRGERVAGALLVVVHQVHAALGPGNDAVPSGRPGTVPLTATGERASGLGDDVVAEPGGRSSSPAGSGWSGP